MKKFFVCLSMAVLMFCAGITLVACGSNIVKIKFSVEGASDPLVQLVVKNKNNEEVEGRGSNFNVSKGTDLRVYLVAKMYGIDFSGVSVKVDGAEKYIFKDNDYSCAYGSENLTYGSFTLPRVEKNTSVSVVGVKEQTVTYNFEVLNTDDETAVEIMNNTYIDPEKDGTYEKFYEFVTNPESKIVKKISDENSNSFNLRVGGEEKGEYIYEFSDEKVKPIALRSGNGDVVRGEFKFDSDGYYDVSFPKVDEKNYTIVVDFKDLPYLQYTVNLPEDNANFSISGPQSLSYITTAEVVVTKSATRKTLVYDTMKVYINDLELQLAEGSDLSTDEAVTYVVPDHITPFSTSETPENMYTIRVEDISYTDETFSVSIPTTFGDNEDKSPTLVLLNEEGANIGEPLKEGNNYIVVKGEKVALMWEFKFDEEKQTYFSQFDLFDFDVLMGDVLPVEAVASNDSSEEEDGGDSDLDEPKFQTVVTTLSLTGKIDRTRQEEQTVEVAEGYSLTVFCDEKTSRFTGAQLEFACENSKEISFGNYKDFSEKMSASYNFSIETVTTVEVDVSGSDLANWTTLERGTAQEFDVTCGQTVVFRLGGTAFVDVASINLQDDSGMLEYVEVQTYNVGDDGEDYYYTELIYKVTNYQFSTAQNVKLVAV